MRTKFQREDGAAAVEFALIVGVLAMLIFGMLQFGVAFFQLQNLRAATREGARIGAVDGTVQNIQDRVENASGISTLNNSIYVQTRTGTAPPATVSGDPSLTKPCLPASGTKPDSVIAGIQLNSPALPQSLREIFTVDIPLMPSISLLSAQVQGEFRCET
jgi:Flp pilus assembly pilin Flp